MNRAPNDHGARAVAFLLSCLLLASSCTHTRTADGHDTREKVELDLTVLDSDGLRGPPDGKVAVSYEFAIPDTDDCRARVKAIDPTVQFMSESRGRVGAGEGQCLCIGSTHQEDYLAVLEALANLPFIDRIIECHFE